MGNKCVGRMTCCFPGGRRRTESREEKKSLQEVKAEATAITPEVSSPVKDQGWDLVCINENLSEALAQLLAIAEDSESIPLIVNKPEVQVYGKDSGRGFLTKTCWTLTHSPAQFLAFLKQSDLRCKWDSNVDQCCSLAQFPNQISISYERYKKVALVSQRDVVIASVTQRCGEGWAVVCTSVSNSHPTTSGVLRATMHVGGHLLRPVGQDWQVVSVSELDFGGALPVALLVRMSAMAMPGYIKAMQSALETYTLAV